MSNPIILALRQGHDRSETLRGDHGADAIYGAGGYSETGDRSTHGDRLFGEGGDDYIYGTDGADRIDGGSGDDVIFGNGGGDLIEGGSGSDTADYRFATSGVSASLWAGSASGGDGWDRLSGIENLGGSDHADTLEGDGGSNGIGGWGGDDQIYGQGGADQLSGQSGDDAIFSSDGFVLDGDADQDGDRLDGGHGDDGVYAGDGDDRINGGDGDDFILGNGGDDVIDGGDGFDRVSYHYAEGGVEVRLQDGEATGADGRDQLSSVEGVLGSTFDDTLIGDQRDNLLFGDDGDDRLYGSEGDDDLRGGDGRDELNGGDQDDTLWGGDGEDVLTGGDGADTFIVDASDDGYDIVTDFEQGVDSIRLDGLNPRDDHSIDLATAGDDAILTVRTDEGETGLVILGGAKDFSLEDLEYGVRLEEIPPPSIVDDVPFG